MIRRRRALVQDAMGGVPTRWSGGMAAGAQPDRGRGNAALRADLEMRTRFVFMLEKFSMLAHLQHGGLFAF